MHYRSNLQAIIFTITPLVQIQL